FGDRMPIPNSLRLLVAAIAIPAAILPASAQEPLRADTSSQNNNPEVTLKSIRDILNSIGPVEYQSHGHDSQNGHDWTNKFKNEASNIRGEASDCHIHYHWFTASDGKVAMDREVGIPLRDVLQIKLQSREEIFNHDNPLLG